ncbi:uncharacterized protein BXZ73DRAFT_105621 [Epithele typhae]|uniref:uncharacterized protein n=1 Tax=Epithele typhae TaxID=378194 RepID=UPI002007315F|nr:uncharacterized protein BXZ73DRAFT_105621 [Epithele typhae]KAH9917149.1 hypothetical protein BXZ73DRAFT_105621 [Epithele typhae]
MASSVPSGADPVAQIILSSALLSQFRYVPKAPEGTQNRSKHEPEDPSLKPWNVLSFLIATGDIKDEMASRVIAVSGSITSGQITVFLVSRNAVPGQPSPSTRLFLPSNVVFPQLSFFHVQKVVDPVQHIDDVVNIAHFFATTPKDRRAAEFFLFLFCVSRCLPKLTSRIENGDRIWSGSDSRTKAPDGDNSRHPTNAIYTALRTTPPTHIRPNTFIHLSKDLHIYLKKAEIPLSPHSDTHDAYPITNENAVDWAQLVMDSFQTMRTYFCDLRSKWRVLEGASFPLQIRESTNAFETMKLFRALLDAGVIKHLITQNVETELQGMRRRSEESKSSPVEKLVKNFNARKAPSTRGSSTSVPEQVAHEEAPSTADDVQPVTRSPVFSDVPQTAQEDVSPSSQEDVPDEATLEAADDDDEEVADASADPDEPVEHHLVRHLRTVTLPLDIVSMFISLSSSQVGGGAPAVQAVYVDHPPAWPIAHQDNFSVIETKMKSFLPKHQTAGSLPEPGDGPFADVIFPAIAKWPKKLGNQVMQKVNGACVHAEAALMARAWLSRHGGDSAASSEGEALIQDVFSHERIPVGVSKKCCVCCEYLAQLLGEPSEDGQPGVEFVLSGTHSTVFPWVPPSGLPHPVLKKLAKRLIDALDEAIKASSKDVGSTQTTPLHASAPLPAAAGEEFDRESKRLEELSLMYMLQGAK